MQIDNWNPKNNIQTQGPSTGSYTAPQWLWRDGLNKKGCERGRVSFIFYLRKEKTNKSLFSDSSEQNVHFSNWCSLPLHTLSNASVLLFLLLTGNGTWQVPTEETLTDPNKSISSFQAHKKTPMIKTQLYRGAAEPQQYITLYMEMNHILKQSCYSGRMKLFISSSPNWR